MKKIFAVFIILVLALSFVSFAEPNQKNKMKRLISKYFTYTDKENFRMKGCRIIHDFDDAVALECPRNVKIKNSEPDRILQVLDTLSNTQIGADKIHSSYTGKGVVVAVLDTGVDTDHPELVSSIVGGRGFGYPGFEDDNGHGTHVSGIITADGINAQSKGVAPDAGIWIGKVCSAAGICYESDVAAAIRYVVRGPDRIPNTGDEPAKIISMSIGGEGTAKRSCRGLLPRIIAFANRHGVVVVAAAGNTPSVVSYPGCAKDAIAVGAVDSNDNRAWFSGYGKALDIMAPGMNIYSSYIGGGYAYGSGTSMATPHISGVIALMKEKKPKIKTWAIKKALYFKALDLGTPGYDKFYGWGRVNALKSVKSLVNPFTILRKYMKYM